jgi:hypothetical protein
MFHSIGAANFQSIKKVCVSRQACNFRMQQSIQYFFMPVSKLIKFSLLKIRFVAERICLLVKETQMP